VEGGERGSVDCETVTDSGAAVVAGEDVGLGFLIIAKDGMKRGEEGVSHIAFGVANWKGRGTTVSRELDGLDGLTRIGERVHLG
jgi:hypothetical protein